MTAPATFALREAPVNNARDWRCGSEKHLTAPGPDNAYAEGRDLTPADALRRALPEPSS
ncbi:hypothetical protein [Dactylosporangium sp. NPDC000521]|uniref:hypothetical protein n=1 Tax=Dactylosporangium sp. NPDC000521 TaxID=3363975 RepID=UPI0036C7EC39